MLLVPRSALPPHPDRLFQPRLGFLYLDESGQMDADRRRPEAVEVQVIGGVMIPDSNSDRDILRVLVDELRRRVHGSETCRDEVKPSTSARTTGTSFAGTSRRIGSSVTVLFGSP